MKTLDEILNDNFENENDENAGKGLVITLVTMLLSCVIIAGLILYTLSKGVV